MPKGVPKGAQNGPPNGPKSRTKINIKYEGFQVPLGSVLALPWVVLGSILGSKIIDFHLFYKVFVKIVFLKKITLGSASWTDLGPILTPKRVPKGSQIGPQIDPEWDRKTMNKSDRFLIALKTTSPGRALQQLTGPEPWRGQGEA